MAAATDVRDQDWYGDDLSGQQHTGVTFSRVDLSETTDDGAVFTDCVFRDCRFTLSRHTDAAFLKAVEGAVGSFDQADSR